MKAERQQIAYRRSAMLRLSLMRKRDILWHRRILCSSGADTVLADGAVVNNVGTYLIALATEGMR